MLIASLAILAGLALLVWSADRFVEGSAAAAGHFGMPPLLIGMVVVGFGTSAPEMVVSALAASQGNPGLALGNAYGSNITNIALILGITAVIAPIAVHSQVMRKELPILALVTLAAAWLLFDGELSRLDAAGLLVLFALLLGWSIWSGMRKTDDAFANEMDAELAAHPMPIRKAMLWLVVGLVLVTHPLVLTLRGVLVGRVAQTATTAATVTSGRQAPTRELPLVAEVEVRVPWEQMRQRTLAVTVATGPRVTASRKPLRPTQAVAVVAATTLGTR